MKLFDAHCHVQTPAAFERAVAKGVDGFAVCGTRVQDWNDVLRCSALFPQVVSMVGIHPWFVSGDWNESFQILEKLLRQYPTAGIGETGLDFQEKFTNRAEQEACFAAHLDLARELNRPVAVHCVHAWGRLVEILREHPAQRILLHAFGGSVELIRELTELHCFFSFGGSVTNPRAERVRAAVRVVPEGRLVVETDSPDFPPVGCSIPNESENLTYVINAVAELRGVSVEELVEKTYENSKTMFF